jgi:hypothetical protein
MSSIGGLSVSMLSQYGWKKFNHYKDNFSLLPVELCSYCLKSITLTIDVGYSSGATATCLNDPIGTNQCLYDLTSEKQCLNDATGENHDATVGTSVDSGGLALGSKEHYKNNN